MNAYCITAVRPKNAQHHLNSEFKLWKYEQRPEGPRWVLQGWKRAARIAVLLDAGDEVLTAKQGTNGIKLGDAVEVELRIPHNGENTGSAICQTNDAPGHAGASSERKASSIMGR